MLFVMHAVPHKLLLVFILSSFVCCCYFCCLFGISSLQITKGFQWICHWIHREHKRLRKSEADRAGGVIWKSSHASTQWGTNPALSRLGDLIMKNTFSHLNPFKSVSFLTLGYLVVGFTLLKYKAVNETKTFCISRLCYI